MLSAKILRRRFVVKIVGDAAWERAREKNVTTDELEIFQNKEYSWRIELLRKVQKFTSNKSDAIIVPSAYLKKIVAGWGIDESKINVVYNSAEVEVSADFWKITKKQAQNQIGLRGGIILSIGRLVPWKGFGGLISIMPGLLSKNPSLMLVIVGDGPSLEDLRFKIEDLRLNENVKLVGVIEHDKLPLYFKATDVFVLNSSYEGLSHVLLEAMAYKTPIIATNVGGNPELIEDGVNGFLVKRGDLEDLKSKILRLHGDEFLRNKFIENSSEKVRRFSFERMINDTIQILGYTNTTL
jgi:glycosyltransferase involved in cell wall biosynthesis